jgi:hypothetical protein
VVRTIAAISLVYDLSAGLTLLVFRQTVAAIVTPLAGLLESAPILVDLNGLFLASIGLGYLLPYRRPTAYRAYLWIFGVGLKTAGAAAFALDYAARASSLPILVCAFADGLIAALTLAALLSDRKSYN